MSALVVAPTYLREEQDLEVTLAMLASLRSTEPDVDVLIVDDGSPAGQLVETLAEARSRLEFELHRKPENTGFAKTVNVGLARALAKGQDAVLVNADMEFRSPWLERMTAQEAEDRDGPADVVGALLTYPNGLIQHAGIFFSLLHRVFEHRYKYAPANLPEAHKAFTCPVTGALQFIRHGTLERVGLYDEEFFLGWEDVDYCLRVFNEGGACVYQPLVTAIHYESLFRGKPSPKIKDWQDKSYLYLMRKHGHANLAAYVPPV